MLKEVISEQQDYELFLPFIVFLYFPIPVFHIHDFKLEKKVSRCVRNQQEHGP